MGMKNVDPTELKIQLEVLREKLKYTEGRTYEKEQELRLTNTNLKHLESEITKIKEERNQLRISLEGKSKDLRNTQQLLRQISRKVSKKSNTAKIHAFLASLLFLLSSILVNVGTTMITSNLPNSLGWTMIALAAATYIVATVMTILFTSEGGNS